MLRRLLGVSAVALAAGLAVAGCAPLKMGAAAVVGDQRVTVANLDTEAGKLAAAAKNYTSVVQLTPQQITQETLSWLIRFQISDELARAQSITVTGAQASAAFTSIMATAKQQAQAAGAPNPTSGLIMVANGLVPDQATELELGRYQAIEDQYLTMVNGGKAPATQAEFNAANAKFTRTQCLTAKSLNIKVNPQFGRLDYAKYQVVSGQDTVSRPSGPFTTSALEGLTPAC